MIARVGHLLARVNLDLRSAGVGRRGGVPELVAHRLLDEFALAVDEEPRVPARLVRRDEPRIERTKVPGIAALVLGPRLPLTRQAGVRPVLGVRAVLDRIPDAAVLAGPMQAAPIGVDAHFLQRKVPAGVPAVSAVADRRVADQPDRHATEPVEQRVEEGGTLLDSVAGVGGDAHVRLAPVDRDLARVGRLGPLTLRPALRAVGVDHNGDGRVGDPLGLAQTNRAAPSVGRATQHILVRNKGLPAGDDLFHAADARHQVHLVARTLHVVVDRVVRKDRRVHLNAVDASAGRNGLARRSTGLGRSQDHRADVAVVLFGLNLERGRLEDMRASATHRRPPFTGA